jgi:hypothetical protein
MRFHCEFGIKVLNIINTIKVFLFTLATTPLANLRYITWGLVRDCCEKDRTALSCKEQMEFIQLQVTEEDNNLFPEIPGKNSARNRRRRQHKRLQRLSKNISAESAKITSVSLNLDNKSLKLDNTSLKVDDPSLKLQDISYSDATKLSLISLTELANQIPKVATDEIDLTTSNSGLTTPTLELTTSLTSPYIAPLELTCEDVGIPELHLDPPQSPPIATNQPVPPLPALLEIRPRRKQTHLLPSSIPSLLEIKTTPPPLFNRRPNFSHRNNQRQYPPRPIRSPTRGTPPRNPTESHREKEVLRHQLSRPSAKAQRRNRRGPYIKEQQKLC